MADLAMGIAHEHGLTHVSGMQLQRRLQAEEEAQATAPPQQARGRLSEFISQIGAFARVQGVLLGCSCNCHVECVPCQDGKMQAERDSRLQHARRRSHPSRPAQIP